MTRRITILSTNQSIFTMLFIIIIYLLLSLAFYIRINPMSQDTKSIRSRALSQIQMEKFCNEIMSNLRNNKRISPEYLFDEQVFKIYYFPNTYTYTYQEDAPVGTKPNLHYYVKRCKNLQKYNNHQKIDSVPVLIIVMFITLGVSTIVF